MKKKNQRSRRQPISNAKQAQKIVPVFLSMENPQLGWGFRKAFSFKSVIKTPFDLLKHLAVWQLQKFNKKSKGGPNGGRKELSAHPMEL
ncbi:hypothetical protein MJL80_20300, partial [Salmonella enterica subsp. enterica serovar Cerro]